MSSTRAKSLKAACFDLDGTLVDTGPLHMEAERQALITLGVPEERHDHPPTFGTGVMPGFQIVANHYDFQSAEHFMRAYMPAWESLFETGLRPMPGADAALRNVHAAGIPLVLVTSGENRYVGKVLAHFGWTDLFAHRVTLESVTNLKPDPEPYLHAAELLILSPEECAGFEDSPSGIRALNAAGLFTVLVSDSGLATENDVDLALSSLTELTGPLISELFVTG